MLLFKRVYRNIIYFGSVIRCRAAELPVNQAALTRGGSVLKVNGYSEGRPSKIRFKLG
jgi:hypothetical protein